MTSLAGVFAIGTAFSAEGVNAKSVESIEKDLEEIAENYDVDLEVGELSGISTQSEEFADYDEFIHEVEKQMVQLEYMSDQDNWDVVDTKHEIHDITPFTASGSTSQSVALNWQDLGDEWVPDETADAIQTTIGFSYVVERNASGVTPTWQSVSNVGSGYTGPNPNLDWEEFTADGHILSSVEIELSASGAWSTSASWNGIEAGLYLEDDWFMGYHANNLPH
ncbi:hypothetical protein DH09_00025 (plasmid) [Bacillaceae bacterium JMAK1]|nr:hypothetical protein DH09_00025 [Bacillaceae bacterium JMAK1]